MTIKRSHLAVLFALSSIIGLGVSYSYVYAFHIVAIIYFAFVFVLAASKGAKVSLDTHAVYLILPAIGVVVWYILSIAWAPDIAHAIRYIVYISCGISILLFFGLEAKGVRRQNYIFSWFALVIIFEVVLSLLEILTPIRWPISAYSEYLHLFGRDLSAYEDLNMHNLQMLGGLATGFRWNPNNLATCMIIALPFFFLSKYTFAKTFGSVSIVFIIIANGSRGNLVALLVMGMTYMLLVKQVKLTKAVLVAGAVVLVVLGGIFYGETVLQNSQLSHSTTALERYIEGDTHIYDSIGIRNALIEDGLEMFWESKGLGIGAGGYRAIQSSTGGVFGVSALHHLWLEMFVNGGVIAGFVFFLWYWYLFYRVFLVYRRTENADLSYYSGALMLSYIGCSIGIITLSSPIYFFPLWIMIGFAIATERNYRIERSFNRT